MIDFGSQLDDHIDVLRSDVVDLLGEMIAIDSTSPSMPGGASAAPGGESAVNDLLEQHYRDAGLSTARIAPDATRSNLVGLRPGRGGGRSLAFNARVDTAGPLDPSDWAGSPWVPRLQDGHLYGLGAVDMKGAGVTMWTVARALHDSGVDLDGDLELHSVVGGVCAESDIGTAAVLDAGHRTDATIALGATAPGGRQTLSTVAAGVLRVEIDITGKVTHCGNRPLAIRPGGRGDAVGVNALEKAMAVMAALGVLEDRWGITKSHAGFPPGSFTIGVDTFRSDAGFAFPAYFPDRATMALSVTYPPSDDPSAVVEEIGEHLRASCADDPWLAEHPPTVRSTDVLPPMALAREHPLVIALTSGLQAVGGDRVDTSDPGPVPSLVGPTDGALYARYGTPTLVFGPGDPSSARHIDESVAIDDVIVAAKALLRTAVAWCGRGT